MSETTGLGTPSFDCPLPHTSVHPTWVLPFHRGPPISGRSSHSRSTPLPQMGLPTPDRPPPYPCQVLPLQIDPTTPDRSPSPDRPIFPRWVLSRPTPLRRWVLPLQIDPPTLDRSSYFRSIPLPQMSPPTQDQPLYPDGSPTPDRPPSPRQVLPFQRGIPRNPPDPEPQGH